MLYTSLALSYNCGVTWGKRGIQMLIFDRSTGQEIVIAENIVLTFLFLRDQQACIEITCPNEIDVSITEQNNETKIIKKNRDNKFIFFYLPKETININDNIKVHFGKIRDAGKEAFIHNNIIFLIEAPSDISVHKGEIFATIQRLRLE